jgi:hypothetical protein
MAMAKKEKSAPVALENKEAKMPDQHSSHVDAYWNATFQGELASWVSSLTETTNQETEDPEYFRDIKLAGAFLTGGHSTSGDWPEKAYLKGSEENEARSALIRLLRSGKPLDVSLSLKLAALFDPERETGSLSSFDVTPVERKLVLRPRKSGLTQNLRKLEMALAFEHRLLKIRQWLGARIEKANARGPTDKRKLRHRRDRKEWTIPGNLRELVLIKFARKHDVSERTVQTAISFLRSQNEVDSP